MAKSDLIKEINSKDIAPEIKEKALAAIERIASTGEYTFFADQTGIADSFDWNDTEEGYDFWYGIAVAKLKSPVVAPSLVIPSSPNIGEAETKRTEGNLYVTQTGKLASEKTGEFVCEMVTPNPSLWTPKAKANAAFIVETWNSHQVLADACQSAYNVLASYDDDRLTQHQIGVREELKAAISLSEGKKGGREGGNKV